MAKRNPVTEENLAKGEMPWDKKDDDENDEKDEKGKKKGEDSEKSCKKSDDLTTDDLEKSLDQLEAFASENDHESRKDVLLEKAKSGDLSDDEREELFKSLGGEVRDDDEPTLSETIEKSMEGNETLQKALDVSDFLAEQHNELCKSLGALADHQQQSDQRQHEFNLLLAKAVTDVGNLVKSVSESVETMAGEPVAPKSRGVNAPAPKVLNKSFANEESGEERLSKSQIMAGLNGLFEEVIEKSGQSRIGSVDLLQEISKFESTGMLHPNVEQAVRARLAKNAH